MYLHKGDNVIMRSGKDRKKTGKILFVLPAANKVVVEGLNLIKRHTKPRKQGQKGQIISKERAVPISSVQLVCSKCNKPSRLGRKKEGDNKTRICKKCGEAT